ncbi:hypothetical protein [Fuchsiella alkaliacetigena]|uniref:hypothetical protein n=1 Tax=Fuchsiella alkaliacetigena TaxID=957042 RepID=UPI00200B4E2E|nr:hypothetical protein [Fuchsiella alkaliacetigena]MCK8825490.1 hypothetical protein [Fuchsiella alkaliacetigena]
MRRMDNVEFASRVNDISDNKYTVLGDYVDAHTPIEMKCNICGNIWSPRPCNLLYKKSGCPECRSNKLRRTQEEFEKLVEEQGNGEYEVLGEYTRSDEKVKIKHKECGYQWNVLPNNFLDGSRCPECNLLSRTEKRIKEIFESKNYEVELFSSFESCRAKKELKFDLGIKSKNNNLLIELDDVRHFQGNYSKNLEEDIKDKIKNNYCLRNNIEFVRIPYWKYKKLRNVLANRLKPNMTISEIKKLIIDTVVDYQYWLDGFIQNIKYRNFLIDNDLNGLKKIAHKTIEKIKEENRNKPDKLQSICEIQQKYKVSKDYIYRLINNYHDAIINLQKRSKFDIWLLTDEEFEKMKRKEEENNELKDLVTTTIHIDEKIKCLVDSELALEQTKFSNFARKSLRKYVNNSFNTDFEEKIHNIIHKDIKTDHQKNTKTTIKLSRDLKKHVKEKLKNKFNRGKLLSALVQAFCIIRLN